MTTINLVGLIFSLVGMILGACGAGFALGFALGRRR